MFKRFSRTSGVPPSSSAVVPAGPPTEPKLKVFQRMITRYPGDTFTGIVQLHLPTDSEVALVEAVLVGREHARIGVLAGSANFETRKTTYYQQHVTILGAAPGGGAILSEEDRRRAMRRESANKRAAVRDIKARTSGASGGSGHGESDGAAATASTQGGSGGGESWDQQTFVTPPTTIQSDQVVRLAAGTYTFPFSVELPDVLPPSRTIVRGKEAVCRTEYHVKARVVFMNGKQLNNETPFTILMLPVQLQRWLQLHRPLNATKKFPVPAAAPGTVSLRQVKHTGPRTSSRVSEEEQQVNLRLSTGSTGIAGQTSGTTSHDTAHMSTNGGAAGYATEEDSGADGYDMQLDGPNANPDDVASTMTAANVAHQYYHPQRDNSKRHGTAPSQDGASVPSAEDMAEFEKTQRRCIDHRVRFSTSSIRKDEAALAEAKTQPKPGGKKRKEPPAKTEAAEPKARQNADADDDDDDRVFDMKAESDRKRKQENETRMLSSEIEKIGYMPPTPTTANVDDKADQEEHDAIEEHQKRMHHHRRRKNGQSETKDVEAARAEEGGEGEHAVSSGVHQLSQEGAAAEEGKASSEKEPQPNTTAHTVARNGGENAGINGHEMAATVDASSVAPPSRTLREPIWEQNFTMPLRSGLMSKSTVGLQLILHSNVLCPGKDRVRVSAIVDNTQGGGPITKVRYSLVVREMIRSKSESYPFSHVIAETTTPAAVQKGKVARLPLVELPVPAATPWTVLTDGGYSTTFLNVRLYSSATLKTYSRSAEVELLMVPGVDEQAKSRRLLWWTNYFIGRGLQSGAVSGAAIDLNHVNLRPTVISASDVAAAEDETVADITESVMGDRYLASLRPGGAAALPPDDTYSVASRGRGGGDVAPSLTGTTTRTTKTAAKSSSSEPLSSSSTAVLLSQHTFAARKGESATMGSKTGPRKQDIKTVASKASPLAPRVRRALNYDEPTYMPLSVALAGGGGGAAGPVVHADPMAAINPLMARRLPRDLDVYEDDERD